MAQSQGNRDYGKDVGYKDPGIPKEYVNVQLHNGGIQANENQRMPSGLGTVWKRYSTDGMSKKVGVPKTPGRTT